MPRLFVAVELPAGTRERLGELAFGLPGARWTPPEQLHLTLRFIGEVDGGVARDVEAALGDVEARAFPMSLAGVGHFPPRGEPRIAWAGVQGGEPLEQLHRAVERAVQRAGVEPEGRRFHAHVTLARLRETPPRRLAEWLGVNAGFRAGPFPVTEFVLVSSVLGSQGATHSIEAAWPLSLEGVDLSCGELT